MDQNILYRRQYIFTNAGITTKFNWKSLSVKQEKRNWTLVYHPDLEVCLADNKKSRLLLLGYLIDPYHPAESNQEILERLVALNDFDKIVTATFSFSGRYILFYFSADECKVFLDATGFRELYYHVKEGLTWCSATPNILEEYTDIKLTMDEDIIQFRNSKELKESDNLWLGYETLYQDVLQLPPNLYYDLTKNRLTRFWPEKPVVKQDTDLVAEKLAFYMKNYMQSVANRYTIHLGITAGWETRLLLAASKEVMGKVFYYVNKTSKMGDKFRDLVIPKRLSKRFKFNLNILEISDDIDPEFEKIYFKNNILAHRKLLNVFYHGFRNQYDDTVVVTGAMANGLARIYYRLPSKQTVTAKAIAKIAGFKSRYARKALDLWLKESLKVVRDNHIDIMDLYQMEQDNSHWGSLTASEQNIVREEMRPFNSREVIRLFWSVEEKFRYQYYPEIYRKIIKILWKDLLKVKVNPSSKYYLYKILRFAGIEQIVYTVYKDFIFKRR